MLYAVPSNCFGWFFSWPQIVFSDSYTDQASAEYSRKTLCTFSEFFFYATLFTAGLRPVSSRSLSFPAFSALCLQLRRFAGRCLGSPSLPHGLETLLRQEGREIIGSPYIFSIYPSLLDAHCLEKHCFICLV